MAFDLNTNECSDYFSGNSLLMKVVLIIDT